MTISPEFEVNKFDCKEPKASLSEDDAIPKIDFNLDKRIDEKLNLERPCSEKDLAENSSCLRLVEEEVSVHPFKANRSHRKRRSLRVSNH